MSRYRETNALASVHFRPEFGADSIFAIKNQLNDELLDKHEPISKLQPTNTFGDEVTYQVLKDKLNHGEVISHTTLSDQFDYDSYQQKYSNNSIFLFALDSDDIIHVYTDEDRFTPSNGWTIVRIGPK